MIAVRPKMAKKKSEIIPEGIDSEKEATDGPKDLTASVRIKHDLVQMLKIITAQRSKGSMPDILDMILRPQVTALYLSAMEQLRKEEEEIRKRTKS